MAFTKDMYKRLIGVSNLAIARKQDADMVIDASFDGDIQYQIAYLYDYYHDFASSEKLKLYNLHPQKDNQKTPVEIKFIRHQTQSIDRDSNTFWMQFRPHQEKVPSYYDEVLGKYGATWPVGMYVDIYNWEYGQYNKWLVASTANYWQAQFPTYELLKCDYVAQWIFKGKKYECAAVIRSQNSYNSGIWHDHYFTTVEDQLKMVLPMNEATETLNYNQRLLIDSKMFSDDAEYRAWTVTKTKRIFPCGVCTITFAQDTFDQHNDYIEKDSDGNIVGLWADYFRGTVSKENGVQLDSSLIVSTMARITASGSPSSQVKVGGSKVFTVSFYEDEEQIGHIPGTWSFRIGDEDADFISVSYPAENKAKVAINRNDSNIGKIITARYVANAPYDNVSASIDVEVVAL